MTPGFSANLSQRKYMYGYFAMIRARSQRMDKENSMKRSVIFAAALALLAPCLPATSLVSPAAAETVIKHKPHRTVVVKKPGHGAAVVRRGHNNRIVWHRPPARPGHFWHRGNWFVRVHGPAFHYPRGWHYRVWAIGAILPPIFLTSEYYYDDYSALGLQAPPPGYRWVRYGDDLLLVNLRTGEVEDVINDVFE